MPYKTVNLPIRVPDGKYCWEWFGDIPTICPFFSNDGGFRRCDLHLGKLVNTDDGILKPEECNSLLESGKCTACNGTGIDVTLGQVGTCNACGGQK